MQDADLNAVCEELMIHLRRCYDEDVVQETLIKFVEYVNTHGLPGLPLHWCRRVARRTRLDAARASRRREIYEATARMEASTSAAATQEARLAARDQLNTVAVIAPSLLDEQLNGTQLGKRQRYAQRQLLR